MINIIEYPEIHLTKKILDEELKSAIHALFIQLDGINQEIVEIDFTVYEGVGSFFSGPLNYDSEGNKRVQTNSVSANNYIFETMPALIVAKTFDYLNPSTFIVRSHPHEDYLVKVQYSEENHFQFILFNQKAFIIQVNGIDIANLNSLKFPLSEIEKRQQEIDLFIEEEQLGDIPHRLASEYAAPVKLFKREELAKAPKWHILNYRDLTSSELKQLNLPFYKPRWGSWAITALFCILMMRSESVFAVVLSAFAFILLLVRINEIPLGKFTDEQVITIRGMLRVHPKVSFAGPLNLLFNLTNLEDQTRLNTVYTFEVLKHSREVIRIHELSQGDDQKREKKKITRLQMVFNLCLFLLTLLTLYQIRPALDPQESFWVKNNNYFNIVNWYLNPDPIVLNEANLANFIPQPFDIVQFNSRVQCNATSQNVYCDTLQIPIAPSDNEGSDNRTSDTSKKDNYFESLHIHYATLPVSNEFVLPSDLIFLPNMQSIFNFNPFFEVIFEPDTLEQSNQLSKEGFDFFAHPLPINIKAYVTKVDRLEGTEDKWSAQLKLNIKSETSFALYYVALFFYLLFILLVTLFLAIRSNVWEKTRKLNSDMDK
ncbi:hypothetical protein [Thorsellia kenyensis]|uniref:Uncharacterized protein n=1 Tax=Thorsellia kenyensis TaxID=1549888 RepID=A0ABV6CBJ7_9GAMM